MKIAVGNSRMEKKWKNLDMSWDEFKDRCSKTVRTAESVAEYKKMKKAQADNIKDVGGFVAGELKQGKRKNGYVICRSMVTLDLDHAKPGIWDEITMLFDFRCLMYSTHKHEPDAPRVRLIIPLSRDVSADEYPAVSRMIGKDIGLDMIDDTCHEAARLMYWPSTSIDGEFLYEEQDGPILDPDKVLARYNDWRNSSLWPMSKRQTEIVKRTVAKQADPLAKEGIVGAFCRTYDIRTAIDTFIPDVYRPSSMEGRYDYIEADSHAGIVLYEDKFCYSFHATDPAAGLLMNSFDVVRVHKFGKLDEEAKEDTPANRLPSYKAMSDFALKDENVRVTLANEREAQAAMDFDDDNWQAHLELDKKGNIKDTLSNIVEILRHDEHLQGIAYNEHRSGIDIRDTENLPWTPIRQGWSDSDMAAAKVYFDRVYRIWSPSKFKDALIAVASERSFHPIKEYFSKLPEWDGVERLDSLLITYLGAEDTIYTRMVTRKTFVAAVARVYEPGIKFDYILVVVGKQGIGKSTLFARVGGEYYSDSLMVSDMRDKSGPEKLQGYWILELSELNGIKKTDVETVKSFISRTDDKYRASYGFVVESHPRQCVIVGSTNNTEGFLRDITGNRRFWPVYVSGETTEKPWFLTDEIVDQIWAEAIDKYNKGEELILSGEAADIATKQQQDAMENDDREGLIREFLDRLLPEGWRDMDLPARRVFLSDDEFGGSKGSVVRDKVCTLEIWAECFNKDPASLRKSDAYELNAIMSRIEGWKKYDGNKTGRVRFPIYGPQNAYMRDTNE